MKSYLCSRWREPSLSRRPSVFWNMPPPAHTYKRKISTNKPSNNQKTNSKTQTNKYKVECKNPSQKQSDSPALAILPPPALFGPLPRLLALFVMLKKDLKQCFGPKAPIFVGKNAYWQIVSILLSYFPNFISKVLQKFCRSFVFVFVLHHLCV